MLGEVVTAVELVAFGEPVGRSARFLAYPDVLSNTQITRCAAWLRAARSAALRRWY
jgi:hypothetical protein